MKALQLSTPKVGAEAPTNLRSIGGKEFLIRQVEGLTLVGGIAALMRNDWVGSNFARRANYCK